MSSRSLKENFSLSFGGLGGYRIRRVGGGFAPIRTHKVLNLFPKTFPISTSFFIPYYLVMVQIPCICIVKRGKIRG
jgi:hypothetical protein